MHIRFSTPIAGHNFAYSPGDVAVWPNDAEAREMCERGIAEEMTPDAAEKAAQSVGRPVRTHRPGKEKSVHSAPERAVA